MRKRRITAILTDIPEKENLRKEQETLKKNMAKSVNKKSKVIKRVQKVKKLFYKKLIVIPALIMNNTSV